MARLSLSCAAAVAVCAAVILVTPAFAEAARVTGKANVRAGPGTNYRVVDSLKRGELVDAQRCRGGWCFVVKRGPNGWVLRDFLTFQRRGGETNIIVVPPYDPRPHPRPRPAPNPCPYDWSCPDEPMPGPVPNPCPYDWSCADD